MEEKEDKPVVTSWKNAKLSNPYALKWPIIDESNEKQITEELKRVFDKRATCLRTIKKKPPLKKLKDEEVEDKLSEEEEKEKTLFRSKFVIGLQQVIKGLERCQLGLVLVSKDVQPAILKATVLQMVAGQDCVAACIGGMHAAVKEAWKSLSSLAAFGVLKTNNADNTFGDLMKCVSENAPKINPPFQEACEVNTEMCEIQSNKHVDIEKENRNLSATVSSERNTMEECVGTIGIEVCNPSKYYVMKKDDKKDFSGQSFIEFSKEDEHVVTKVTEFENGRRKFSDNLSAIYLQMAIGFPEKVLARSDSVDVHRGTGGSGMRNSGECSNKRFKNGYRNVDLLQRTSKQDKKMKKKLKGKKNKK